MFRVIAWALIALYLLIVGVWAAAATPVALVFAGLGVVTAAIPGPAWLIAAVAAWLKHRPAPVRAA